jgi:hypothetical protein
MFASFAAVVGSTPPRSGPSSEKAPGAFEVSPLLAQAGQGEQRLDVAGIQLQRVLETAGGPREIALALEQCPHHVVHVGEAPPRVQESAELVEGSVHIAAGVLATPELVGAALGCREGAAARRRVDGRPLRHSKFEAISFWASNAKALSA